MQTKNRHGVLTFMVIDLIGILVGISLLITALTGCSVKVEADWVGQTAKDNRQYTKGAK